MALLQSGNYAGQATTNLYLTPDRIAREALFRLKHHLVFPRMAMNQFGGYMGTHEGNTINIKLPFLTKVAKGVTLQRQNIVDRTTDIVVDKRYHFALDHSDTERTFDINDFSGRYVASGIEELAYMYEIDGANELTFNAGYVHGKPGLAMSTKIMAFVRAFASEQAIPLNMGNYAVMHPVEAARLDRDMIEDQKVNHPGLIMQAVRTRFKGAVSHWSIVDSVHIPFMTNAAPSGTQAPKANASTAQSGSTIITDGWGNTEQKVLNKGQVVTFAGVTEVIPRGDRRSTGRLKRFTVTADVTCNGSGQATIPISPGIITSTTTTTAPNAGGDADMGGYQNASNGVADNAVVTVEGDEGKTYRQALCWERNALQYINVMLEVPDSARERGMAHDPETGLSVTMVEDFTITDMKSTMRADILYGVKTVYPEVAIRLLGDEITEDYL